MSDLKKTGFSSSVRLTMPAITRIEADQAQGLIAPFDARPVAFALNRVNASTFIDAFGQRPRSKPKPIQEALARIWISTLYGAEWVEKGLVEPGAKVNAYKKEQLPVNRQSMLQRTLRVFLIAGISLSAFLAACAQETVEVSANVSDKPRLVLQITVDQFRGDLPTRYADRLGEGGLRYLLEEGIHYNNAHHAHANTETIVGHVTLATGAHPAAHGMIGNIWFDRTTGLTTYNIEDPDYRLLTEGADIDADTEIDPTQKAATSDGRSPRAILTTTFSDELASLTGGKAKIFGVSVKDRGAVSMAGHTGKAFWFSKATNQFVTSSYYYDEYPQWIVDWNARKLPETYANTAWELLHPIDTYLFGDQRRPGVGICTRQLWPHLPP